MNNTLYTIYCPKCLVLEQKLKNKNIPFDIIDDQDEVVRIGRENHILSAPILKIDNECMDFQKAIEYIRGV